MVKNKDTSPSPGDRGTGLIIEEGCFWIQAGAKLVAALGWLVAEAEAEVGVFFAQLVVVFWL